jgi:chemotaxis signal transduction protein
MSRSRAQADELREEFDASFAREEEGAESTVDLLLVGVGSWTVAVETSALAATEPRTTIVSVPDAPPGMLGLCGVRGAIVAVYDLARVLGAGAAAESRGVILLPKSRASLGLFVSSIAGHLKLPTSRLLAATASAGEAFVSRYAETEAGPRPVCDLDAVVTRLLVVAKGG